MSDPFDMEPHRLRPGAKPIQPPRRTTARGGEGRATHLPARACGAFCGRAFRAAPWAVTVALALTHAGASAQAQRLMVPHDEPSALIALVDTRAGALVNGAWLDVANTAIPTPGQNSLRAVERVGDQIWVASGLWVYRYDAVELTFLDSFRLNALIRSIDAQSRRTIVTTTDSLILFDLEGEELGEIEIYGAGDTLELRDSMLVAIEDESRVDRYTLDGTWLGTFAGPSIPTTFGILSRPRQLGLRRNGNVLVSGGVRVYEFSPFGDFLGEYDVGPFEGGVAETFSGRLFVPLGNGVALYDVASATTTRVGGLFFGTGRKVGWYDSGAREHLQPFEASSDVICRGPMNSTGLDGRAGILGSQRIEDRLAAAFGERLPPGAPTMLLFAARPAREALGIGTLCVNRESLQVASEPQLATAEGQVTFELLRGATALFPVMAGANWYGQLLYRDGGATLLSGAFRVRFQD